MSDKDLNEVAVLLAKFPNGEKLADQIGFALFDSQIVESETESV